MLLFHKKIILFLPRIFYPSKKKHSFFYSVRPRFAKFRVDPKVGWVIKWIRGMKPRGDAPPITVPPMQPRAKGGDQRKENSVVLHTSIEL